MTLTARTTMDQIEVIGDGSMQIRLTKIIEDDGAVIASKYHRTMLLPGDNLTKQMKTVNDHLVSMGQARVATDEIARIKTIADAVHTKDVVDAFKANQPAPGDPPKAQPVPTGVMERKTIIDQVVYRHDGAMHIRASSVIEDNGNVLARVDLPPLIVDATQPIVAQLADAGLPPIEDPKALARAQAVADVAAIRAEVVRAQEALAEVAQTADAVKG